jgi:hypothetical protein
VAVARQAVATEADAVAVAMEADTVAAVTDIADV